MTYDVWQYAGKAPTPPPPGLTAGDVPPEFRTDQVRMVSIVDDDAALRASISDLMLSAGYVAMCFPSAEAFLKSDAHWRSDVIVTDLQMGGLDGVEMLKRLKRKQVPTPVIVITGRTDQGAERRAIAQGCAAFLRKPFQPAALLDCVEAAFKSR